MSTGHGIHKLLSLLPCCGQLFVQANAPHTKRTQQLSESTLLNMYLIKAAGMSVTERDYYSWTVFVVSTYLQNNATAMQT